MPPHQRRQTKLHAPQHLHTRHAVNINSGTSTRSDLLSESATYMTVTHVPVPSIRYPPPHRFDDTLAQSMPETPPSTTSDYVVLHPQAPKCTRSSDMRAAHKMTGRASQHNHVCHRTTAHLPSKPDISSLGHSSARAHAPRTKPSASCRLPFQAAEIAAARYTLHAHPVERKSHIDKFPKCSSDEVTK